MDLTNPVTTMNFTENQQGNTILEKLHYQRKLGQFCDVTFHIRNELICAHRNVMAACSPFFDTLLKQSHLVSEQVSLDCKDKVVFEILLEYIYTGSIVVDRGTVEELICLSNRFMMPKLKNYCCEYLERNMTIANCFMTKDVAQKTGLVLFAKTVESFIMANIMDVIQQEELLAFSDKKIMDFVSNKTLPVREEIKIHVMNRWVRHSLPDRQYRFHNLLGTIAWVKVNVPVVYTLLREDILYKTSPWCLYSMLKALEEKEIIPEAYRGTLDELRNKYNAENMADIIQMALNSTVKMTRSQDRDEKEASMADSSGNRLAHVKMELVSKPEVDIEEDDPIDDFEESDIGKHEMSACLPQAEELYPSLESTDSGVPPLTDDDYNTSDIMNLPKELDDFESLSNVECTNMKKPGRHKRKGIPIKINPSPIKVRIAKVKLRSDGVKIPKRRGRPPKLAYKKLIKKPLNKQSSDKMESGGENIDSDERELDESEDKDFTLDSCNEEEEEYRVVLPKPKISVYQGKAKRNRKEKVSTKLHCPDCHFLTTNPEKFKRHREKAHTDTTMYSCCVCSYQSAWNKEYYNHMKTHFPGPPFLCDYSCGYTGERIQNLLYHRMSHTDERPYECTVCNMTFRSKNNLAMHARCHTGLKPFHCEVCNRSFATKGTLDQHSVTHSDLRPYLCDLCGFSTKYQSHLIAHKRIHSGDVFRCQYPNCKYSTPKRSQLACHMRTHMSIRSHICSQCGRAFVEKSHLVRHEKIHLDDKPFKCGYCDYGSTRRDKLKDHVIKYHGESSPKMPYKPRKSRRQTFDPQAFPLLNSEHASAEMQSLLQQSVELREQERQDNIELALDVDDTLQSQLIVQPPTSLAQPLFTVTATSDVTGIVTNSIISAQDLSDPVVSTNSTGCLTTDGTGALTTLHAGSIQSMLPTLLDPRVPVMLGTNQQPIMVVPHPTSHGIYGTGTQINPQAITQVQTLNQNTTQQLTDGPQQEFSGLQFMNIF